jgi:neutral ceramidase
MMNSTRVVPLAVVGVVVGLVLCPAAGAAQAGPLRIGAAKVDITPPQSMFPIPGYAGRTVFVGVHDPVFARAIVLDNGNTQAAIIAVEVTRIPEAVGLTKRVAAAIGIPSERLMVAATHDHNSPLAGPADLKLEGKTGEYYALMEKGIIAAALEAKAHLQPARMGLGRGKSYVNANRDENVNGRYQVGSDPEGPSDKTVEVIRFDGLDGEPIAIFTNYAVHGDVMFLVKTKDGGDEITGDLPGVASRYIEDYYKNKVIAVWTSGAAGDQEVPFMPKSGGLNPGAAAWAVLDVQSRRLGQEVVRVAGTIRSTVSDVRIWGAEKTATCPGQRVVRTPGSTEVKFENAPPVDLQLGLIMLNDIALSGVSGEVVTLIGEHLKKASPFASTIIITHADGTVGYIPDDSSYPRQTFEVLSSPFKPGCTEPSIVNGLIGMMKSYADQTH